ncbi:MAG TPA: TetR/AcrR family transcriptional regulator [Methanoregulaceae archaeon]|nr:TetR/AcrR family transcriptional regulator [Methanoregulaceae archaeon]
MGITERKKREKEQRKKEIIDAAETLFFSREYDDVSMDEIATIAELNKATIYLYFKNKEALFSTIVLRGIRILNEMYRECREIKVPGVTKIALLEETYYRFTRQHPDYQRLIRYYGVERFSKENPGFDEIQKEFSMSRDFWQDAVREGIDDGTIRNDLNPFLLTTYLMITLMGVLSVTRPWLYVLEREGVSHETFVKEFTRFISPAVSTGVRPDTVSAIMGERPYESLFFPTDPVNGELSKKKSKKVK